MRSESAVLAALDEVFAEKLHIEVPSADTDLLESGILDSFQFVELVLQLELRFGFKIDIDEIDLEDLRTPARIGRLLARQREAAAAAQ
ncbi:MAG: phosphopantetheine-binding protein [Betaproteobacteria bacterium]|nr:phosphopantetheine-binding protein [Betaproteobacteria bacterium]